MMLSATQLANTEAGSFDVQLQYFAAGKLFGELTDLADFAVTAALPTGWSASGNTITAGAGWADCTADIVHEGAFEEAWDGGQTAWRARVRGYSYDSDLYAPGYALCCLRRTEQLDGGASLLNADFETFTGTADDGTTDTLAGWTNYVSGSSRIEASAPGRDGTGHSLKVTASGSAPYVESAAVGVTAGALCCLTFWYKQAVSGCEVGVWAAEIGDFVVTVALPASASWSRHSLVFSVPAGVTSVQVDFAVTTSGTTVYIDDASLTAVGHDWELWWLGVIDAGTHGDDYRQGAPWERNVRSIEAAIEQTDSPRLTTGTLNVLDGASASASSTLATPAAEAGAGEFIGATASVQPGNAVDGRVNTVWISQAAPRVIGETAAGHTRTVIDEVFNSPWPGYSRASTWWFEIFNNAETDAEFDLFRPLDDNLNLYARNNDGEIACLSFAYPAGDITRGYLATQYTLQRGERGIVCGDAKVFNAITGGLSGAKWVLEAKSFGAVVPDANGNPSQTYRAFDLHPTDGWLALAAVFDGQYHAEDLVLWGSTIPAELPHYVRTGNGEPANGMWTGAGVDVSGLQAGYSIRRAPTGTDTNTAADWTREEFPRPGDKWQPDSYEWLQITAPAHTSTLGADAAAGATTLTIQEGTTGWLDRGDGLLDYEAFTYTGRTATTLTGVSGLAADHLYGEALYPLDSDGDAMTGWYTAQLRLQRRAGLATLAWARVYLSPWANARTPDDVGWESDYHVPHIPIWNPLEVADITLPLSTLTADKLVDDRHWVRTILIIIDAMNDWGRAKLNEVTLDLHALALNDSGLADLGAATAGELAGYLLDTYTDYGGQFTDSTPEDWGLVGQLALAIAPLPDVLANTAQVHGCVIRYHPNGEIELVADPWWPGGRPGTSWDHAFDETTVRGAWTLSDARPSVTGVALNATGTDGAPLGRVLVPPGATGSTVREVSGVTVRPADATALAWNLYWQARNTERLELTVKGIGEWCSPLQRYLFQWDDANLGQWICEGVNYTWAAGRWECRLSLRKYFN